jgi:hypothetical protein
MSLRRAVLGAVAGLGLFLLALAGCSSAGLDIQYPAAGASALPLPPSRRHVDVGPVTDGRANTARIGVDPKSGDPVVTSRSVTDIVREALLAELGGYDSASVSGGRVLVLAAIEDFRLDEIGGYGGALYVGRVVIALRVIDEQSGETMLTRRYVGIKRWQVDKPSDAARRETMDASLARTMHDLATDPALARALGRPEMRRGGDPGAS